MRTVFCNSVFKCHLKWRSICLDQSILRLFAFCHCMSGLTVACTLWRGWSSVKYWWTFEMLIKTTKIFTGNMLNRFCTTAAITITTTTTAFIIWANRIPYSTVVLFISSVRMHTLRSWRQIITQTVADSVISASQVDWTGNGSSNGLGFDGQEGATEEMWATGLNQTTEASELVAHRMPRPNYHLILGEQKHSIDLNLSFRIVFYLIYGLIFAFGIIGNLLVCWVVFRQTSMRTVTNIFIANLALSDILLCLFCVPFTPLYLLAIKEWQFGQFSNLLCHLVPFAQGVSVYLSVFTMCAISIERYSVIVHPFRSPITVSSCITIIFFIWVFAIILTLPYGIFMQVLNVVHILPEIKKYIHHGNETGSQMELTNQSTASEQMSKMDSKDSEFVNEFLSHPKEMALNPKVRSLISLPKLYCDEMWPGDNLRVIYGFTTTIIQFIMPFCIITFCYFKVCARLWDRVHTRPGNRNCSNQRKWLEKERARRTTQMLIWMVGWSRCLAFYLLFLFLFLGHLLCRIMVPYISIQPGNFPSLTW